jgi:signal transduction histidine kinase/CheY-like chemotaxis protein
MQLFNRLNKPFSWLRPAEPRVLVEQLKLILSNLATSSLPTYIGASTLGFLFHNPDEPYSLIIWCLLVMFSRTVCRSYAKFHIKHPPNVNNAQSVMLTILLLSLVDGMLWGCLLSVNFLPSDASQTIFIFSIMTAASVTYMVFLAPIISVALAFTLGEYVSIALQILWMDESQVAALGLLNPTFLVSLIGQFCFILGIFFQTINNSSAITKSIELRFVNKDLYQQAETARQQAMQANAAKSKFLAAASHDLRQPVHAQGLFLEVLGQTRVTPHQQEIIDSLRSATRATRDMLDSLLDFSRIEAGVIHPVKQNFPLQQLLHAIENDLAPVADAKKLAYRSRDTRVVAQSDPTLVDLILRNLVSNAIRYTDHGGVLVACRQRGDKVVVEVCDTGIGIAPENQQDIFKEFHQLGNPERDRRKGLGLGLAIVKGLTNTLGHRLTLSSRVGSGSIFRLELPLVKNIYSMDDEGVPEAVFTTPLKGHHALVIEDDETVLQAMVSLLRSWGMSCDATESLSDALQFAKLHKPHVLVCDFRLREQTNGTEVIAAVRQALDEQTPAVLITGDTSPERLQAATRSGIAVLHKPVAPDDLYKMLSSLLHSK